MDIDKAKIEDLLEQLDRMDRLDEGADPDDYQKSRPILWRNFTREVMRIKGWRGKAAVCEMFAEVLGISESEVRANYRTLREQYLESRWEEMHFADFYIPGRDG